ncbi:DUF3413 domain-containing protein [Shewanella maritima]|uniref:DUF3413 domain-containing protein n=1 Tax=Shewanella maritima TaxID=2520507 RepID=UPI003735DE6B
MAERKKQMNRDKVSRLVNWGHWFAFFNGFLAMLAGTRYLSSAGYPDSLFSWGYIGLSTIGHFTFLAFLVYLVFIFPVTLLLPYSKILRGYTATIYSIALYAILYDTLIFDDYGIHLSPFAFDLAWQDLSSILRNTSYISVPIGILLLELTAANFIWKRIDKIQKKQAGNKVVLFVGACFVSGHLIHIWADATQYTEITRFDDAYPLSYPATARSFIANRGIENFNDEARPSYLQQKSRHLNYPISPMQCSNDFQSNVLVVTVDSFRADMVTPLTMPFLSGYQSNHFNFNNHYTGGNQFYTGMFSLLYGVQTNYSDRIEFSYTPPVITGVMQDQGYELQIFSADDSVDSLRNSAIFEGFEVNVFENVSSASTDAEIVNHFSKWQSQQDKPWFSIVNLTTPRDYDTPVGFLGIETIKSPESFKPAQKVLFNQYRQSLFYLDQQLEKLLSSLPADTSVIITGTHGQVFTSNERDARRDFSPGNVKVPLIMRLPEAKHSNIKYRTSHYGLVPTLLTHLFGCTNPTTDYSSGRSLFQPSTDTWVYIGNSRVFAIYQREEVTVLNRHGKYEIYDLEFTKQLDKRMSAPELIQVMRESRRLYNN